MPSGRVRAAVLPFALCNDARLTGEGFLGDPTEAALVVLAAKEGVDADQERRDRPRVGEVPFDATTKYMATFHSEPDGRTRVHVKGAVDVLLGLCVRVRTEDGVRDLDEPRRDEILGVMARLGGEGLRVRRGHRRDRPCAGTRRTARPHPGVRRGHRRPAPPAGAGGRPPVPHRRRPGQDDHR
ncbi:hypothetical protein E4N62_42745 [Streptomyces sp. MNU76]|uniref:hypothetical protein n=1 Tax=Streptomyces sp. MNU76 TaxID=2560026 RepID=UPI001E364E45|nr:hypothetical protein [Streptomyces sp. MNU76]MCC9711354.1 hypothetical protein [Streptomyces sp. MNU76]